ncbi:MAG: hypothetical protein EF813_04560 [Methanosarcinales archaeon]|nr:MAG: hypothetical protein EF813_04560 [Methanosarcinales archaeon]
MLDTRVVKSFGAAFIPVTSSGGVFCRGDYKTNHPRTNRNYSGTYNHYQGTSLCRNYPGCGGYYNQTGNLTVECAEGRGGEING